jgi:hypothetical protein
MQLYQLSFPNGKKYIGITSKTAQERFKEHCNPANNKNACQNAIVKYGKENVVITVLSTVDNWELLCLAEIEAIEKFNSHISKNGYNLTIGGEGNSRIYIFGKEREDRDRQVAKENKRKKYIENKSIINEKSKKRYLEKKEAIKKKTNDYYHSNKDAISIRAKKYRDENKEKIAEMKREYNKNNKEKVAEKKRIYALNNKEIVEERIRIWREKNKNEISERRKIKYQLNKEMKKC